MAKKLKPNTTKREVLFAITLLKALHANVNNYYLLIAIIAWMRGTSGPHAWANNNPLKIHGGVGYRSVIAGAYATARVLLLRASRNQTGYRALLKNLRGAPRKDANKLLQGVDFLQGIALVNWDGHHYGQENAIYNERREIVAYVYDSSSHANNRLFAIVEKLNGHPLTIPGTPAQPAPKVKAQQPPKFGGLHPATQVVFIQPYAARDFYQERHVSMPLVVVD